MNSVLLFKQIKILWLYSSHKSFQKQILFIPLLLFLEISTFPLSYGFKMTVPIKQCFQIHCQSTNHLVSMIKTKLYNWWKVNDEIVQFLLNL